jgi:hypothetical protein
MGGGGVAQQSARSDPTSTITPGDRSLGALECRVLVAPAAHAGVEGLHGDRLGGM